jgi:hypothetical protein
LGQVFDLQALASGEPYSVYIIAFIILLQY